MSVKSEKQARNDMSRRQFVGATLTAVGIGVLQNNVPCYSQPAPHRSGAGFCCKYYVKNSIVERVIYER
jgi:hypothetical protein